jgi:hypothetical protein
LLIAVGVLSEIREAASWANIALWGSLDKLQEAG